MLEPTCGRLNTQFILCPGISVYPRTCIESKITIFDENSIIMIYFEMKSCSMLKYSDVIRSI